ncbi:cysteine hydrolase family protein [Rhizobium oryzicola]|uniref:Isochorismatase family cysteine hydrolase n=1 Tax=Rhizobium oryzicola TaxID=1232668 RepID=A0ABT8T0T9_9HYPH|nr:isochorismatase family cysteine hydrolase [Rhizobium oryzicola]MDO1584247.1 isochorismatase family cysteine hydrolase [Rhizobium oryzicola]
MSDTGICRHLCVDMQRLFGEETPWHIPWMDRVREPVAAIARAHPAETIFTRFVPPRVPDEASGMWRDYFEKWSNMTRSALGEEMVDLLPELRALVPPAKVFDKPIYSPWLDGKLHRRLQEEQVTTLVISGGETDVCVLAAVMGAIDLGYRIILAKDAICSVSDETHDKSLALYASRFSVQLSLKTTEDILRWWG